MNKERKKIPVWFSIVVIVLLIVITSLVFYEKPITQEQFCEKHNMTQIGWLKCGIVEDDVVVKECKIYTEGGEPKYLSCNEIKEQ